MQHEFVFHSFSDRCLRIYNLHCEWYWNYETQSILDKPGILYLGCSDKAMPHEIMRLHILLYQLHCCFETDKILSFFTVVIYYQLLWIHLMNLFIYFKVASLILGHSCDCPSTSKVTLKDMDKFDHYPNTKNATNFKPCACFLGCTILLIKVLTEWASELMLALMMKIVPAMCIRIIIMTHLFYSLRAC